MTRFAGGIAILALMLLTGCANDLWRPSGSIVVWVQSGDDDIRRDSPPLADTSVYSATAGVAHIDAAINETVSLQVALRSTQPPAGPYRVRLGDFVGKSQKLAANDITRLYRVENTRVDRYRSWYPAHTGRAALPADFPDILVPLNSRAGESIRITKPGNEIVWIDVRIPPMVTAGEYRSRLEVFREGAGFAEFACALVLTVAPVALPGPRSLPVVCRIDPRELLTRQLKWEDADSSEELRLLPDSPTHAPAIRTLTSAMRVFHDHRMSPVLWAGFPKYQPTGDRSVSVDWTAYDALVGPWLDGSAFDDNVGLDAWPIPVSIGYPDAARNGGVNSPRYARLVAAYLDEAKQHFADRGWLSRAFTRPFAPATPTTAAIDDLRQFCAIVQRSETQLPIVAHLPARSLRALGWNNAPPIDLPDISIWSPPAMWFESEAMRRERTLTHRTWVMPDHPPYSGSLRIEAPPTDARTLGWLAYRYESDGLWIEHAADGFDANRLASAAEPWRSSPLIYPGAPYGLSDEVVPSIRLKRLLRGIQDYELLRLLERRGRKLLAQTVADQLIRWAMTDAAESDLLSTSETGWPSDPATFTLARRLLLQELVNDIDSSAASGSRQVENLAQWGLMMNQADRASARVDGARLLTTSTGLEARIAVSASNKTNRPLRGKWKLTDPAPPIWRSADSIDESLPPGARRARTLTATIGNQSFNAEGQYPFAVVLDTPEAGALTAAGRLAVAAAISVRRAPKVDGRLDDWPIATNNRAAGFRLIRAGNSPGDAAPALATEAAFCMDERNLYVAIRCELRDGIRPFWRSDNAVPFDGAIPWEQDVVEVLIDPRPANIALSPGDVFVLQVKPSGVLSAQRGYRTDPPICPVEPWNPGATAATLIEPAIWVTEIAIPLSSLGASRSSGGIWGVNITRLDARRGEYSSWSAARRHAWNPQTLGNLILPQ